MDEVKQQAARIVTHSVKLGFPPNALPDLQYLEKIGRTRNCPMFDNFLQRTEVVQKVDCIRKNILIHAAKEDTNVSQSLPLQLQKFMKFMKLKAKLQQAEKLNNQTKEREKAHLDEGFATHIRKMKCEDARRTKETRVNILRAKAINLKEQIEKEADFEKKIRSVSPPKYSAEMNVEDMKQGIKQCLSMLNTFYSNSSSQNAEQLWANLRNVLNSVPNIFTFQTILKQLNLNNNALEQLISSLPVETSSNSALQELMLKLKQHQIIAGIELLSQKRKSSHVKSACSEAIRNVTNELEDNLNVSTEYSFGFSDEDVVADYVSVMLKQLVLQGKYEYANSVVNRLRGQSDGMEKANKLHMLAMQDTQKLYELIEEKLSDVQQSIAQLFKISLKLNFVKISMTHLVQDVKTSSKQLDMSRILKMTTPGEDVIPEHLNELRAFLDTPVVRFENISNIVASELSYKHEFDDEAVAVLTERKHLFVPDFNQLQDSMKNSFALHWKLQPTALKIETKIKCPPEMPISELKKQLRVNRESICELFDEITKSNVATKSLLRENHLLYEYSLKNPLKKFIPSSKKFDGKSFKAYETEFNLYYNMLKD